jgi:thymidylate kinase
MKCFFLAGYFGCGKTTQANLLQKEFPQFNYLGGKSGLDAIGSVKNLVDAIKTSESVMIAHGCIYQSEPSILRFSRLTDLTVIVLNSLPQTVKDRSIKRGATEYDPINFKHQYNFIRKLPQLKKFYTFKLEIVDNNKSEQEVHMAIKRIITNELQT